MKHPLLFIISIFSALAGSSQGVFNNQTNQVLEKVVQNYPSGFKNIRGEVIAGSGPSAQYKSTLAIPGSISSTITESITDHKLVVAWESVLYTTPDFAIAKTKLESLFNQIKNTIVKPVGGKASIVNGLYMDPAEDKTYNTIQFDLLPAYGELQKVNIDLLLEHAGKQWKIILSVYNRERKEMGLATTQ